MRQFRGRARCLQNKVFPRAPSSTTGKWSRLEGPKEARTTRQGDTDTGMTGDDCQDKGREKPGPAREKEEEARVGGGNDAKLGCRVKIVSARRGWLRQSTDNQLKYYCLYCAGRSNVSEQPKQGNQHS